MSEKTPFVQSCCCYDLKTGTLLVGVLELIASVSLSIFSIFLMVSWAVVVEGGDVVSDQVDPQLLKAAGTVWWVTMSIILFISVLNLVVTSILIHGAKKGRPGLLTPWLVLTAISVVLQLINIFGSLIFLNAGSCILALGCVCIEGYFYVCVTSFRGRNFSPLPLTVRD